MTAEVQPVRAGDVERAIEAVRGQHERARLAALAYDVLSRQAEGRAFYAGKKLAQTRAAEHGVERDAAETAAGNLLAILERGAESSLERALVAALYVSGVGDALSRGEDAETRRSRFVRHADWLEVCTDYTVYPFVDPLLDVATAAQVWEELAQSIVDDAAGRDGARAEVRARNAARLSALAASPAESAQAALRRVANSVGLDEATHTLASTLAGDRGREPPASLARVSGYLGRAPGRGAFEVLRWLSGWALLTWAARAVMFALGVRRTGEVKLSHHELEVHTEVSLLGRTIRQTDERWRLDTLEGAGRQVRYPTLQLLIGVVALSIGVLFGGLVLFDGVRSGELILVMLAAGLLLGGAALDLALDVLLPGRQGRVVVEVAPRSRRPLRLTSVPLEEADTFLRSLRIRNGG